jgi:hypothetical protein
MIFSISFTFYDVKKLEIYYSIFSLTFSTNEGEMEKYDEILYHLCKTTGKMRASIYTFKCCSLYIFRNRYTLGWYRYLAMYD